jgi:hypothetical protein
MAFQQPTSEDFSANAHYMISFCGIAGSPTARSNTDRDHHQAFEPASLLVPPRPDLDLLAGEVFPVSERSPPSSEPGYLRGASSRRRGNARSVILLPSSRDYDANHPNLDAHSAAPRADLVECESFHFGELCLFGVCFVCVCDCLRFIESAPCFVVG